MLQASINNLISGLALIAAAVYLLLIAGPAKIAKRNAAIYNWGADFAQRHWWAVWIGPILCGVTGSYLLVVGLLRLVLCQSRILG
jgi:hypothetical protein